MDENNKDDVIKNDSNNIETNEQTIEKTETNVVKEEQPVQKQDTANNNNATANQQPKDKKGFSIAALVLGIVAIVLCCVWYISIPCGILAIVFGTIGLRSSKRGMSISGIVTGIIGMIISIFIILMLGEIMNVLTSIFDSFNTITLVDFIVGVLLIIALNTLIIYLIRRKTVIIITIGLSILFIREDLPTFDLPEKAISGLSDFGICLNKPNEV